LGVKGKENETEEKSREDRWMRQVFLGGKCSVGVLFNIFQWKKKPIFLREAVGRCNLL